MATQLLKYVGNFTTDAHGQIFIQSIMDVTAFQQINVAFSTSTRLTSGMTVNCEMGVLSGRTIAATVAKFPLDGMAKIYSFAVVGPEFSIVLTGGPPNATTDVGGWAFLR